MTTNNFISIVGYDVIASAVCDFGAVLILNNNSTHYMVVETEVGGQDGPDHFGRLITQFNPTARVVATFPYGAPQVNAFTAYRQALAAMAEVVLGHSLSLQEE